MASDVITTYSAIGRLKTPRAFVTIRPRSLAAGVETRSTPAEAKSIRRRRGDARDNVIQDRGRRRSDEEDSACLKGRLVGIPVDAAIRGDPGAADTVDLLDACHQSRD